MKFKVFSVAPNQQVPTAAVPLEGANVKRRVSAYQHLSELVRAMSQDARMDNLESGAVRITVSEG
jgi:hypothetical protein